MACGAKNGREEGAPIGAEPHTACHAPGKVQKILRYCWPRILAKNKILMSAQISVETYFEGGSVAVNPPPCSRQGAWNSKKARRLLAENGGGLGVLVKESEKEV